MANMKLLVIGIDGGDEQIIGYFMPKLNKIKKELYSENLQEDLWSRGWAKIMSGKPGHVTEAYYNKVIADGDFGFTASYTSKDYVKTGCKPLWEMLNEKGFSVGMMAFPTTMPAPKVNGFIVSGGGAGSSQSGEAEISDDAIYPKSIKKYLLKNDYIFDIRFSKAGVKNFKPYCEKLRREHKIRTDCFMELSKRFKIDAGFICYKSIVNMKNLARKDIEDILTTNKPITEVQKEIIETFNSMDKQINKMISKLNPEKIMFVSDHGSKPKFYNINLNKFLQEYNYQKKNKSKRGIYNLLVNIGKKILPKKMIITLSSKGGFALQKFGTDFNIKKSKAFSVRYINGIYINDERFGGPINDPKTKENLIEEIINKFNSSFLSKKGFKAYKNKIKKPIQPDILIDFPEGIFFEGKGELYEKNSKYQNLNLDISNIEKDSECGIKGKKPIFFLSKDFKKFIKTDDKKDLTLVYKVIERWVKNENSKTSRKKFQR